MLDKSSIILLALVVTLLPCLLLNTVSEAKSTASLSRVERSLTEDAERIVRQSSSVDVNNVGQLIDLVEKNKADECLARVICELSYNTRSHGESGSKFAQSLLKFRTSKHPKIKQYTDAMAAGAKAKATDQCKSYYPNCSHQTSEVIIAGNKVLRTN